MASPRTRRVLKDLKVKDENNVSWYWGLSDLGLLKLQQLHT